MPRHLVFYKLGMQTIENVVRKKTETSEIFYAIGVE